METLEKHPGLQSRLLKSKRLAVQVKVEGNATPASKKRSSDLPGVAIVLCQGQTSEKPVTSPAISNVTPDDATGKFSIILDKAAIGEVDKILQVSVVNVTSTNAAVSSISEGYIVIDIDSAADLTAANAELRLIIDYLKK